MKMNICVLLFLSYSVLARHSLERRIIEGNLADISNYPWAVSLLIKQSFGFLHNCGGSIITPNAILSAAHCFLLKSREHQNASQWVARIGSSYSQRGGIIIEILKFHFANYIAKTQENDLAVVQTLGQISFEPGSVLPAVVAHADYVMPVNVPVTAIGWGKTGAYDSFSGQLRYVHLMSMSNDRCNEVFAPVLQIPHPIHVNMECTAPENQGGTCTGDSGSPLLYQGILVAVTSWSGPNCNPTLPSVFTRVSPYYSWIKNITTEIRQ